MTTYSGLPQNVEDAVIAAAIDAFQIPYNGYSPLDVYVTRDGHIHLAAWYLGALHRAFWRDHTDIVFVDLSDHGSRLMNA
jgi:hypothetical protein